MEHIMKLRNQPFDAIKTGRKTIELRLYDRKRQQIQVGDTLTFQLMGSEEQITATVTALHRAASFGELFQTVPVSACGFEGTAEDAVKGMRDYYTETQEQKNGVVGIELSEIR